MIYLIIKRTNFFLFASVESIFNLFISSSFFFPPINHESIMIQYFPRKKRSILFTFFTLFFSFLFSFFLSFFQSLIFILSFDLLLYIPCYIVVIIIIIITYPPT